MRLKTKLVLAITALVLLISGLLSLVYVSQMLHASVEQSYETNRMVANQVNCAVKDALETGLKDRKFDPSKPYELRELAAEAIRGSEPLQVVIDSVNLYSVTVYDINIADTTNRIVLSTDPENQDKPLPSRPDFKNLQNANPIQLISEVMLGPAKVFDVVVPLERNDQPFLTIHVGVRTTFLRQVYSPWILEALTLMGIRAGNRAAGGASAQQSRPASPGRDQHAARLLDIGRRNCRRKTPPRAPTRTRPPGCPPRSSRSASACATWRRSSPR